MPIDSIIIDDPPRHNMSDASRQEIMNYFWESALTRLDSVEPIIVMSRLHDPAHMKPQKV